ncbi:hypothetical protein [Streptomyces sp. DSM 118878]
MGCAPAEICGIGTVLAVSSGNTTPGPPAIGSTSAGNRRDNSVLHTALVSAHSDPHLLTPTILITPPF